MCAAGITLMVIGTTINWLYLGHRPGGVPGHARRCGSATRVATSPSCPRSHGRTSPGSAPTCVGARAQAVRARSRCRPRARQAGRAAAGDVAAAPSPRPHADDVPHREDAGQLAALDHDEVAEPAADHRRGGVLQRPVRAAKVSSRSGDRRPAPRRDPALAPTERRMSRSVMTPGPGASGSRTTAAPTCALPHRRRRLSQRVTGADGEDHFGHPLWNQHAASA